MGIGYGLASRRSVGAGLAFGAASGAAAASTWWDNDGAIATCLGAWAGKGAASLAASYTDLTGNGKTLGLGVAPAWATSTGWSFNGSSQYLTTGINLATGYTIIVRYTGAATGDDAMGVTQSPNRLAVRPNNTTTTAWWYGNTFDTKAGAETEGVIANAGGVGYFNGAAAVTISRTISTPAECYLGGANTGGGVSYFAGEIQAAAVYSGTLNAAEVAAVTTAMAAIGGTSGWWDNDGAISSCVGAYAAKGAAAQSASYTDLTGVSGSLTLGVAPTWDSSNGWIFNGSTQYLRTPLTPATDQTWSMFVQFTNVTDTDVLAGTSTGANQYFWIQPRRGNSVVGYFNGGFTQVGPILAAGNLGIAGGQGYRNGAAEGAAIGAWSGTPTLPPIVIGALNSGSPPGTPNSFIAAYIQAIAFYNATLDAAEVAAVAAAMALI